VDLPKEKREDQVFKEIHRFATMEKQIDGPPLLRRRGYWGKKGVNVIPQETQERSSPWALEGAGETDLRGRSFTPWGVLHKLMAAGHRGLGRPWSPFFDFD